MFVEDELHARDGAGGEYATDVPNQFRLQITNETVRTHVLRAYQVDAVCLGYENASTGRGGGEKTPQGDGDVL